MELGPGGEVWFGGVLRNGGSGPEKRNEAVRKCQTAGKRAAKRAKVRGHNPQEAPRTSGKVTRNERSKKRRLDVMREL